MTPEELQVLQREIGEGCIQLRQLVERGGRGELRSNGVRVDVGSLHLVGERSGGWLSPNLVIARDGELIEEDEEHVLVRLDGDPSQPVTAGGLFFGVHSLRKDQLHTFKRKASSS